VLIVALIVAAATTVGIVAPTTGPMPRQQRHGGRSR